MELSGLLEEVDDASLERPGRAAGNVDSFFAMRVCVCSLRRFLSPAFSSRLFSLVPGILLERLSMSGRGEVPGTMMWSVWNVEYGKNVDGMPSFSAGVRGEREGGRDKGKGRLSGSEGFFDVGLVRC